MLINLSNHPSARWSEEQRVAATETYGEVIDLPFPAVDPTMDEAGVADLCKSYLQKIKQDAGNKSVTVHLMGEMTFTFALVSLLHAEGIPCVASTTERLVKETEDKQKEVMFKFCRFRKYCLGVSI